MAGISSRYLLRFTTNLGEKRILWGGTPLSSCLSKVVLGRASFWIVSALVGVMAMSSKASSKEQIIGFYAKHNNIKLNQSSCEVRTNPIFEKLLSALKKEVGSKVPTPQLRVCNSEVFSSSTTTIPGLGRIYFVNIPNSKALDEKLLPPILAHEIYHVFQFSRYGSKKDVINHYGGSIRSVELAADFGAGYLLSRINNLNKVFEMNPFASGDFKQNHFNHHGRPVMRSNAFRRGLFFTRVVSRKYGIENAEKYYVNFEMKEDIGE